MQKREYGDEKKWSFPQEKNYTWSNVIYDSRWKDHEWPNVIRYYDKAGVLLKNKVLEYVNKHLKQNISAIADDTDQNKLWIQRGRVDEMR